MTLEVPRLRPRTAPALLLVAILALPALCASASLGAWAFIQFNHQAEERSLLERARVVAMALDAKLQAYQAAGLALAAIDGIHPGANDSGV